MFSRTSRSTDAGVLALSLLAGCGAEGARVYAVTVTDDTALTCHVEATGAFDEGLAASIVAEHEGAYAAYRDAVPAEPQGYRLTLVEADEQVSAWLEPSAGAEPLQGTRDVLDGPLAEEFVEVAHETRGYATAPSGGLASPDPVVLDRAVLTATRVDAEIAGRLRVTEATYGLGAPSDPPDTHLSCARNLALRGAELP